MSRMLELESEHVCLAKELLSKFLPAQTKIWVFGSRIKGTAKQFSDLDLAIELTQAMSKTDWIDLKAAFDQSLLPMKVDLVRFDEIDDSFKAIIDQEKELFLEIKK